MADSGFDDQLLQDFNTAELRHQLREAIIDRDGWKLHAQLTNNHLQRILRSPAWRMTKPLRVINLIAWKLRPELKNEDTKSWQPKKSGQTVYEMVRDSLVIE